MKKIKLNSKELSEYVKKFKKVNEEIGAIYKVLSEADKEHKKLAYKAQRLKDKGIKILDKVLKEQYKIGEFEYSGQMERLNSSEINVDIHDVYSDTFKDPEALKERLREDKKNKKNLWQDSLMFTGHEN